LKYFNLLYQDGRIWQLENFNLGEGCVDYVKLSILTLEGRGTLITIFTNIFKRRI
jgi:hypothetical protein